MNPQISRVFQLVGSRPQCFRHHQFLRSKPGTQILKDKASTRSINNASTPKKAVPKLDPVALHRLESMHRVYHKRRMVYSGIGVVFGMIGLYITAIQAPPLTSPDTTSSVSSAVNQLDSSQPINDSLVNLARERKVIIQTPDRPAPGLAELVPTGNTVVPKFPRFISGPTNNSEALDYSLLGLGVRTVSFLKIQVYVVGIYIAMDDIPALRRSLINRVNPLATSIVEDEMDELHRLLRDPNLSEQTWDGVLRESKCRMIIRIVPTRNTDFGHLRDGWVRGLTARSQKAGWQDEEFGKSMSEFKRIFVRGSVPKGKELLLNRGEGGNLGVWYKGEETLEYLGEVRDERVSRAVWLAYLAGKTVACEDARSNVITNLINIVK